MQIQSAVSPSKYFSVRASRQQGRNSLAEFDPSLLQGVGERFVIQNQLRHAVDRGGARPALPAEGELRQRPDSGIGSAHPLESSDAGDGAANEV